VDQGESLLVRRLLNRDVDVEARDRARTSRPAMPEPKRTLSATRTRLVAATIAAVVLATPSLSRAQSSPTSGPLGPTTQSPSPDDTRFGTIGKPSLETAKTPPPGVGIGATQLGHVTYAGLRVDVPFAPSWSIIPQAALLRVSPYRPEDPVTVNTYVGGGIGVRPAEGWSIEGSAIVGPRANEVASLGFALASSTEIGADWKNDVPPPVTIEGALSGTRFNWANGLGPAGSDVTQYYLQLQARIRAGSHLVLVPKVMYFIYDKSLDSAQGAALGTVSTLARVGSYAPSWMGGLRMTWIASRVFAPFVEGEYIGYASSIGDGTKIDAGVRVALGRESAITAYGGVLVNHVGGPLVPPEFDLGTVPVFGLEAEVRF
jgi:hypothetical protein